MRITRHTIPTCIVALLFIALGVQSDPSLYSQTWHRHHLGSPIFALPWYEDRVSRSRTLLAMGQSRGWSLLSEDRNRRRSRNSPPSRSFDRMKTSEKVVYGTIRVLADTIEDYIVGFVIGLTIGAVLTLPKVILRSSGERVGNELGTRSLAWAQQTGEFLGSFRGCATAVRLIRSPKRDNWNIVYGCATAGAFIGRNQGPVGMATSALIWGTVIYLLEYKTDFCPISRHRENMLSPFRTSTRRSHFGM